MAKRRKKDKNSYDPAMLKAYSKLPAVKKLQFLEEMRQFFWKYTPVKSQQAWKKLQEKGF